MTLQWILGWWNLIFLAPFAVALVYLFACTLSGVGIGDGDADAHGDVDADADADIHGDLHHDVDADADADAHADVHADADGHDADGDGESDAEGDGSDSHDTSHTPAHAVALAWLGVGRVPLSLIALVLLLTWGAAGFVTNAILRPHTDWQAARVSLPVALLTSLLITRSMVLLIARFVPLNQNLALRRSDLVGEVGQALYGIDEKFGLVAVRDERGDLKQLPCRVAAGVEPIPRGARVKLIAYRATENVFFVSRTNHTEAPGCTSAGL
jgi:membrane protein implicated in regulation of membrane protease activity